MPQPQLFVYGRTPSLSAAELAAVFRRDLGRLPKVSPGTGFLISEEPIADSRQLIAGLGGTVKIGRVLVTGQRWNNQEFAGAIADAVDRSLIGKRSVYGLSFLGQRHHQHLKRLTQAVKRRLAEQGIRVRYVLPREGEQLSSVTVEKEGLLEDGAEVLIGQTAEGTVLARTEAVQPFEALSQRDYGRPQRDPLAGMLPPKLAMILVNLSGLKPKQTLLDPFCGSGTILQEAELLGFQSLVGTDGSPEAIAASRENLKWLLEHSAIDPKGVTLVLRQATVDALTKLLGPTSVEGIVSEPFLGPPLRRTTQPQVISRALQEVTGLYRRFLAMARTVIKPNGVLVTVVPMFRTGKQSFREPSLDFHGFRPIEFPLLAWGFRDRRLVYGRPDQHVFRKILALRKQ